MKQGLKLSTYQKNLKRKKTEDFHVFTESKLNELPEIQIELKHDVKYYFFLKKNIFYKN